MKELQPLTILKNLYQQAWPKNKMLEDFLNFYQTLLSEKDSTTLFLEFKDFINNRATSHPLRSVRTRMFDSSVVSESQEFKMLNKKLDSFISPENSSHILQSNDVLSLAVNSLSAFIQSNPGTMLLLFLSLTGMNHSASIATFNKPLRVGNTHSQFPSADFKYHDIPAIDVSSLCTSLENNIAGGSGGKICYLADGQTFYLKKLKEQPSRADNDAFLGEYNRRMLNEYLEIDVPDTSIFYLNDNYYLASAKAVYTEGRDFALGMGTFHQSYDRKRLAAMVGERGLAQYAVASTLIKDLHSHNWGVKDNQVFIIDADQSPTDLASYMAWTAERFRSAKEGTIGFALSLANIVEMKQIFEDLLAKPLLKLHESVDMDPNAHSELLRIYIDASAATIASIQKDYPHFNEDAPDEIINGIFSLEIHKIAEMLAAPASEEQMASPRLK